MFVAEVGTGTGTCGDPEIWASAMTLAQKLEIHVSGFGNDVWCLSSRKEMAFEALG